MANMTNATNEQLELGFNGLPLRMPGARRMGRIARAGWWFAQMRGIVERAMDREAVDASRPEQIWIPGARSELKV
ncbi:MAG: hypothetical protein KGJ60_15450 [Verrucomicrobiota bacterium]|nr:hypothetical protein [Verrucomicrobiota bacterium]